MRAHATRTPAPRKPPARCLFAQSAGSCRRRNGLVGQPRRDLYLRFLLQRPYSVSYRGDDEVAHAGDGFDVARGACRVTQRVAQFLDGFVEAVVKVDKDV